jgi:two-component system sensor histidine kinase YesM
MKRKNTILKNKLSFTSTFKKVVFVFILIIIPIYALGFHLYMFGTKAITNEITHSFSEQSSWYLENLDDEFSNMQVFLFQLENNEDLHRIAIKYNDLDEYAKYTSMENLHNRLAQLKANSLYISDVKVYFQQPLKVCGANSFRGNITQTEYNTIEGILQMVDSNFYEYDGRIFITKNSVMNGNYRYYMIEVELDLDALKKSLAQFDSYYESEFILSGIAGNTIYSNDNEDARSLLQILGGQRGNEAKIQKVDGTKYLVASNRLNTLDLSLIRYVSASQVLTQTYYFGVWFILFTAIVIFLVIGFSYSIHKMVQNPITILLDSFDRIEHSDFKNHIQVERDDEFGHLYHSYNSMIDRLEMLVNQNYKSVIMMQEAELKQLQSQINPHFLYNSLFLINTMARTGDENLIPFSKYLGTYFRFMTRNAKDIITLEDEVAHSLNFAKIQEMRFKKRMKLEFASLEDGMKEILIPRLSLQPILENAFEHAIEKQNSKSIVMVNFGIHNHNTLRISIEDSGENLTEDALSTLRKLIEDEDYSGEITGMVNVNRRMKLFYKEKYRMDLQRSILGGLKVLIEINLEQDEEK